MARLSQKYLLGGANGATAANNQASVTLHSTLRSLGKLAESAKELPDALIVADLDRPSVRLVKRLKRHGVPAVLVRNEPHVVAPWNYSRRNISYFDCVVDFGRDTRQTLISLPWPQVWPESWRRYAARKDRSARAVVMNANKLSLFAGEFYSLRRSVIDSGSVDFFGPNWESGFAQRLRVLLGETLIWFRNPGTMSPSSIVGWFRKHNGHLGLAENKLETLSGYQVAFVAENSREYMSEKLLDALFAGCIPVYVGPPVANFGIPEDLVVEVEPTLEDVKAGINKALSVDRDVWFSRLETYLSANETKDFWSAEYVLKKLVENLDSWLEERRT